MPALVRNSAPRGPRFYEEGGKVMFVHVLDASTQEGPREATKEDEAAHPEALARFLDQAPDDFPGLKPPVTFGGEEPEVRRRAREARVRR